MESDVEFELEIIALVLSVLSFVVSIILAIYEIKKAKDLNDITLESVYFDDLYKEILVKRIPNSRAKMTFDSNYHLIGTDDLIDNIKELRKNSLYFQYADKKFYEKLKSKLFDIEDYIIKMEDKQVFGEEQIEFYNTVHNKLSDIYSLMLKKYKGNKIK